MNRTRIAAVACVLCCILPAFASATIYWSAGGDFFRAAEDGTGLRSLPGEGTYFTLELLGGKRYWHKYVTGGPGALMRSNLNGSVVEQLYEETPLASDLALDIASDKVYVALLGNEGCGTVFRQNLDGSGFEQLAAGVRANGIALDLDAGKLYWATSCGQAIIRSNLDGSDPETVVALEGAPSDMALDLDSGKIYWARVDTSAEDHRIERSNLDGSGVETVVSGEPFIDGIALDLHNSKLYWAVPEFDLGIRRADLDGGNVEIVISGVDASRLEIDPFGRASEVPAVGRRGTGALVLLVLLASYAWVRRVT